MANEKACTFGLYEHRILNSATMYRTSLTLYILLGGRLDAAVDDPLFDGVQFRLKIT
jgi:hypothetical protein